MRKAFICPTKYVQGEDELLNLGYFVKTFGKKALLIAHKDDIARVQDKLDKTAAQYKVEFVAANFNGECSRQEVARLQEMAKANKCACTIGLGGGKAIDTAKCVAKGEALIICPTIAATDAPTSHSAVLYTPDGAFDDYAYFKQSPSVILIDTSVIAKAPVRFLVSGMGDALSTYFEARANVQSFCDVNAGLPCGADRKKGTLLARGTNAAFALATLCYQNLLADGYKAKLACESNVVTPALENIIETTSCSPAWVSSPAVLRRHTPSMTVSPCSRRLTSTSTARRSPSAPSASSCSRTLPRMRSTPSSTSASRSVCPCVLRTSACTTSATG